MEAGARGRKRGTEGGAHRAGAASEENVVEEVAVRHLRPRRRAHAPPARPPRPPLPLRFSSGKRTRVPRLLRSALRMER